MMVARLDTAVEKGCDGVEPDNVQASSRNQHPPRVETTTWNLRISFPPPGLCLQPTAGITNEKVSR